MKQLSEKTLAKETVYQGKIIQVDVDTVELPNGKTSKREIVHHQGAVGILAVTDDQKMIFVRQYRKPLEQAILEIPAGKLEQGESPLDCAIRELKEETGYTTTNMTQFAKIYTSPGFADEVIYLFKAEEIQAGQAIPDEDEFVELVQLSLDEAVGMIKEGKIMDAKTVIAVQYRQLEMLKEEKK